MCYIKSIQVRCLSHVRVALLLCFSQVDIPNQTPLTALSTGVCWVRRLAYSPQSVGAIHCIGSSHHHMLCHARSLLLTEQQLGYTRNYWEAGLSVGPHLPQLAQSAKAMRQRARDCTDHELHHFLRCIMSSILYPSAPHHTHTHTHTQFGCHAICPPTGRASKLTLPSCSTDLGSSL